MISAVGGKRQVGSHLHLAHPAALSSEFASLLGGEGLDQCWPAGRTVGLEHEYRVTLEDRPVDFRELVHELGLGQRYLDPGDPNAYRLSSGAALTADEAEAELALPPTPVVPGFGAALARAAARERVGLEALLPQGAGLSGYSTHLSVAVPPAAADAVAQLYARTFAPALMLLMDEVTSPGLLVRPRPGRIELGGEFVAGPRLAAAALFAVGSVRACLAAITEGSSGIPDLLAVSVRPDDRRYGWFVGRDAFGGDLYTTGRMTELPLAGGGRVRAQQHLESCWSFARFALGPDLEPAEARSVASVVFGGGHLPGWPGRPFGFSDSDTSLDPVPPRPSVFGRLAEPISRPGYDLAPVMMSWERAVFLLGCPDRSRRAFANVAGPGLETFEVQLERGALDDSVLCYLEMQPSGRRLDRRSRAITGLFDDLAPQVQLLVPERGALTPRRRPLAGLCRWRRA